MFTCILFPRATPTACAGCAGNGNGSDSSELDLEFDKLSLGQDDDGQTSDLDYLYSNNEPGHASSASKHVAASFNVVE